MEREFLVMRAKILELAACMDRIGRAPGDVDDTEKMALIRKGIDILSVDSDDRAERVQVLFSNQYNVNWQNEFQFAPRF